MPLNFFLSVAHVRTFCLCDEDWLRWEKSNEEGNINQFVVWTAINPWRNRSSPAGSQQSHVGYTNQLFSSFPIPFLQRSPPVSLFPPVAPSSYRSLFHFLPFSFFSIEIADFFPPRKAEERLSIRQIVRVARVAVVFRFARLPRWASLHCHPSFRRSLRLPRSQYYADRTNLSVGFPPLRPEGSSSSNCSPWESCAQF